MQNKPSFHRLSQKNVPTVPSTPPMHLKEPFSLSSSSRYFWRINKNPSQILGNLCYIQQSVTKSHQLSKLDDKIHNDHLDCGYWWSLLMSLAHSERRKILETLLSISWVCIKCKAAQPAWPSVPPVCGVFTVLFYSWPDHTQSKLGVPRSVLCPRWGPSGDQRPYLQTMVRALTSKWVKQAALTSPQHFVGNSLHSHHTLQDGTSV